MAHETWYCSHLNLGDQDATQIAAMLKIGSYAAVDLSHNSIGDASIQTIAQTLTADHTLATLDLSHNFIQAQGAKALSEILAINSHITELNLGHNFLGRDGVSAIAAALKRNTTLRTLNLDNNYVGGAGATALAETLSTNITLTHLSLEENSIPPDILNRIQALLARNQRVSLLFKNIKNAIVCMDEDTIFENEANTAHALQKLLQARDAVDAEKNKALALEIPENDLAYQKINSAIILLSAQQALHQSNIITACEKLSAIEPNDEYFAAAQETITDCALQQLSIWNRPENETILQHIARLNFCQQIINYLHGDNASTQIHIPNTIKISLTLIVADAQARISSSAVAQVTYTTSSVSNMIRATVAPQDPLTSSAQYTNDNGFEY